MKNLKKEEKLKLSYHLVFCSALLPTVPEGIIIQSHDRNTTTHNPPLPHASYALRAKGVGGWCSPEDALHPGSISTSSAVLINQKTRGTEDEYRRCLRLERHRCI